MRTMVASAAILFLLVCPAAGCSQSVTDRKLDGLTGVVFNYSDEVIAEVRVDGELAGTGYEAVRPGDVTGGGRTCCMALNPTLESVDVVIIPAIDDPYIVQATIEQPWPKGASTAIVHLLPGRKVVIETTLGVGIAPRRDLINTQLESLGIEKEVEVEWGMIPERNQYSEYMNSNNYK